MAFYGDGKHNEDMEYNPPTFEPLSGIQLIQKERNEQLTKHKHSIFSDYLFNDKCELYQGAQALLEGDITWMPESWDVAIKERMISKSYKERLIIAGALIAAELDRLNYVQ